jgi:hypothetical protein
MQFYSDPSREDDRWSLPDCRVYQLTSFEAAELMEDEIWDAMKKPEFRLASVNSRAREDLLEWIVDEYSVSGGWFWDFCVPGCMPDSCPNGPFDTAQDAIDDCRDSWGME